MGKLIAGWVRPANRERGSDQAGESRNFVMRGWGDWGAELILQLEACKRGALEWVYRGWGKSWEVVGSGWNGGVGKAASRGHRSIQKIGTERDCRRGWLAADQRENLMGLWRPSSRSAWRGEWDTEFGEGNVGHTGNREGNRRMWEDRGLSQDGGGGGGRRCGSWGWGKKSSRGKINGLWKGLQGRGERDTEQRRVGMMEVGKNDGGGGGLWGPWRGKGMVVRRSGGGSGSGSGGLRRRQQRPKAAAAAAAAGRLHTDNSWTRQGEAAVSAARTAAARGGAAAAEAAVGLLPCSSLSSHLRGRRLLSFFKWRLGFVGGSLPLL